jgi:hypothetical protein
MDAATSARAANSQWLTVRYWISRIALSVFVLLLLFVHPLCDSPKYALELSIFTIVAICSGPRLYRFLGAVGLAAALFVSSCEANNRSIMEKMVRDLRLRTVRENPGVAFYEPAGESTFIVLACHPSNSYVAESKQRLSIVDSIRVLPVAEAEMFPITGECRRTNLFLLRDHVYLIRDQLGNNYTIDMLHKVIRKVSNTESAEEEKFVGSFDTDEAKRWRFIPASGRR